MEEKKQNYWDGNSENYSSIVNEELETEMHDLWLNLIKANMPKRAFDIDGSGAGKAEPLDVLDSGCGPGFFSILMTEEGHRVTAVDFSEGMLNQARANASHYVPGNEILFRQMDVHNLDFPDESFDLIVSRNITWTLQNPTRVYKEWLRVLKPGGRILVFDANWNRPYFDEGLAMLIEEDQKRLKAMGYEIKESGHGTEEDQDWVYSLPLNFENRPIWDVKTLLSLGCTDVHVVTKLDERLMNEYYRTIYSHIPIFMVCASK